MSARSVLSSDYNGVSQFNAAMGCPSQQIGTVTVDVSPKVVALPVSYGTENTYVTLLTQATLLPQSTICCVTAQGTSNFTVECAALGGTYAWTTLGK